jgi:hypothetical protein
METRNKIILTPDDRRQLRRIQSAYTEEVIGERLDDILGICLPSLTIGLTLPQGLSHGIASGIILPANARNVSPDIVSALQGALKVYGVDASLPQIKRYLASRKHRGPKQPRQERPNDVLFPLLEALYQGTPFFEPDQAPLPVGGLNCEFLNAIKGQERGPLFAFVLMHVGVLLVQEADENGVKAVVDAVHEAAVQLGLDPTKYEYSYVAGEANSRGQGNHIIFNSKRLKLKEVHHFKAVANIKGIMDLRETVRAILEDSILGLSFAFDSGHYKSLRGGWELTSVIRNEQTENYIDCVESQEAIPTVAEADYNCFLDKQRLHGHRDVDAFLNHGWNLVAANDTQATHRMGGRLDGAWYKYFPTNLVFSNYRVFPIFSKCLEISDHGNIYFVIKPI